MNWSKFYIISTWKFSFSVCMLLDNNVVHGLVCVVDFKHCDAPKSDKNESMLGCIIL